MWKIGGDFPQIFVKGNEMKINGFEVENAKEEVKKLIEKTLSVVMTQEKLCFESIKEINYWFDKTCDDNLKVSFCIDITQLKNMWPKD